MGFTRILLVASPESVAEISLELSRNKALGGTINPLWGTSEEIIAIMFAHGEEFNPIKMAEVISSEWPDSWIKVDSVGEDFSLSSNVLTPKISDDEKPYIEIDIKVNQDLSNIAEATSAIAEYFGKEWFYEKEKWSELEEYELEGIRLRRNPLGAPSGIFGSSIENYGWLERPSEEGKND